MKRAVLTSYGVVPIYRGPNGHEFLVVEQYGVGGTHWGFPKGRPHEGESPAMVAQRELKEETGVTTTELLEDVTFMVSYEFTFEDTLISKTVHYFIGFVEQTGLALQEAEVKNALWLSAEEVARILTHESTRAMFARVQTYLANHER